ncbi:argonaute-like protein [Dendrothele bispora CBS 962.96]|uniref:Argonaute-like protein n=1 Tax=Dendrothele bispora (strain CBS 962.96) TaxID=1314807 RepID=A0A4V4HF16_DENBC|nr:argonaute-like protein [Dendrothele bispora CBS 962.96]
MAPRIGRDSTSRGGSGRGRSRGGTFQAGSRGGAPGGGLPTQGSHITTVGVKRPSFGTTGQVVKVKANVFEATVPQSIIRHYDVVISPIEQALPQRMNMEIIDALQSVVAPDIFTPPAVYDGRKNMFATRELPLGPNASQEFSVTLHGTSASPASGRPPKTYKVKLTKVASINPEVLERFIKGDQSHDNVVLTAITALNVVIRMEPTMKHTFNIRSFFTAAGSKPLGLGFELWQGLFQSVRPGMGRMLINVDLSTGLMYRSGPLIDLCLEFLEMERNVANIRCLFPKHGDKGQGVSDSERRSLSRFLHGVKVTISSAIPGVGDLPKVIKRLSDKVASQAQFQLREGGTITVADHFRKTRNSNLQFPHIFCVEVGNGALIPLELCTVIPGQIARKQIPSSKTKDVVQFSTKKPVERLAKIVDGVQNTLAYGRSEYVRQFGINVQPDALVLDARILAPPTMKYGRAGTQSSLLPKNGAWNMLGKQFVVPAQIKQSFVVVFEQQRRFTERHGREMLKGLFDACKLAGMKVENENPPIRWLNAQSKIVEHLKEEGRVLRDRLKAEGSSPAINLVIIILPEGGHDDIYSAVKYFGDISVGVATQCMRASKCLGAKPQYYANVALKINVKLGGINTIPESPSINHHLDPRKLTIVMGADVIHPAPGSEGRPSYAAVVGSIDSSLAKYAAVSQVQTSRQEIISGLDEMTKKILRENREHQIRFEKKSPPRPPESIIVYRDGVSEGQFKAVLDSELPLIKNACKEMKINPKITLIVVGKRHHIRFFPTSERQGDHSGNCPAGTVVDTIVAHPTEFDFYLQSHGGLLGTSRSAHYSVLYDENNFSADALQSLSFALCHVYARSTRSVSIPAPVYYADIVCSRARNHYDPDSDLFNTDSNSSIGSSEHDTLQQHRDQFKSVNPNLQSTMYFS